MAGNNSLLEKLEGLVSRFEEISTLITDPAVIADQKRYVKLTKEYKDLNGLMKARNEYIQAINTIDEAKEIIVITSYSIHYTKLYELKCTRYSIWDTVWKYIFHPKMLRQ